MTLYGATDPQVCGQPISPFFGQQNGNPRAAAVSQPVIPQPSCTLGTGVQNPLAEAMSRGALPRNALVTSVGGVSCGAQNATPVGDLCTNGAGAQLNLGVAVPNSSGNPSAISQASIDPPQMLVDGIGSLAAGLSTGPVPTDIETLTSAPVAVSTTTNNIVLQSNGFQG